jgi:hypothetical protein
MHSSLTARQEFVARVTAIRRTLSMCAASGSVDCIAPSTARRVGKSAQPLLGNSQVRKDVVVGAAIRRVLRKGSRHGSGQLSERLSRLGALARGHPDRTSASVQTAIERANRPDNRGQGLDQVVRDRLRRHKRVQDG